MPKFEELVEIVRKLEGGAELADKLILAKTAVNKEAADSRIELKDVNEQLLKMGSVLEKLGAADPEKAVEKIDGSQLTIAKLQTELKDFGTKFEALETKLGEKDVSEKSAILKQSITALVTDFGPKSKEALNDIVTLTSGRYKQDDQGDYVTNDGKSMKDDLTSFIEDRPHLLESTIKPGAGAQNNGGGNGGGVKKHSEYSSKDLNELYKNDPTTYKQVLSDHNKLLREENPRVMRI